MYFRLGYTVAGLWLREGAQAISFDYDGPHHISVSLRPPSDEERTRGHSEETSFVEAIGRSEPSPRVLPMFESLLNNMLPEVPDDGRARGFAEYVDTEGRIKQGFVVPLSLMPEPFRSFVQQIRAELSDYAKRTVLVLRWRAGRHGSHSPFASLGFEWSHDATYWHQVGLDLAVFVEDRGTLKVQKAIQADVTDYVRKGLTEPLGHTLFREAWEQRLKNPRSALILGMAAAETGFKQCVSTLIPESRWLMENLPAPPLYRMVAEYFPFLPTKKALGGAARIPDELVTLLKRGGDLRNRVAHVGDVVLRPRQVEGILHAVQDLLWLLDFYQGYEWALSLLRSETRQVLGIEKN